ncbi:MAG: hypothetical protein AB7F89_26945 [Pirellulaceae bacterium]
MPANLLCRRTANPAHRLSPGFYRSFSSLARLTGSLCLAASLATPLERLCAQHEGNQPPPQTQLAPLPSYPPAQSSSAAAPAGLDDIARSLLLSHLPRSYENTRQWGGTRAIWNGLHVSRDGLQIKTKRRWKEVNHGTWTRYHAWLIDPEHQLRIRFANWRTTATRQVEFDLTLDARLGATGRVAEWNRGIQLYSFHADAEAVVQLQTTCQMALRFDAAQLPPAVQLVPRVTDARLTLQEFHLQRISNADGPLIHHLGDALRGDLEREVNERRDKLVEKLNRGLEKNSSHLRLSLPDLARQGWSQLVSEPAAPPSK